MRKEVSELAPPRNGMHIYTVYILYRKAGLNEGAATLYFMTLLLFLKKKRRVRIEEERDHELEAFKQ